MVAVVALLVAKETEGKKIAGDVFCSREISWSMNVAELSSLEVRFYLFSLHSHKRISLYCRLLPLKSFALLIRESITSTSPVNTLISK
jgi:hypothetical protein